MVDIRRLAFTRARVKSLVRDIENGRSVPKWLTDPRITKKNGIPVLHVGTLRVVPREDQEAWLRDRLYDKDRPPISFSRDAGYDQIQKETLGISRRAGKEKFSHSSLTERFLSGNPENPNLLDT